ncbi:MAG TPA: HNH endonuclease [Actinomycetota bacterium]
MHEATVTALPIASSFQQQLSALMDASSDQDLAVLLRAADRLTARAVELLASRRRCLSGVTEEMLMRLEGRRARWDARDLSAAADALAGMPMLRTAFSEGVVSWSQTRAIVRAVRTVDAAGRARIDALIRRHDAGLADSEPEALLDLVDEEIDRLRLDLAMRREQAAIDASFLVLQPRIDGYGGSIYGEVDTEGFASIAEALDAACPTPTSDDREPASRARERMNALVGICEASLAGHNTASTRPPPRLLATVDLADLIDLGAAESARVLWRVAGRRARITPLATQLWACDAEITPIIFDRGQPIGVGETRSIIPAKVRAALIARDQGCRFPGCSMPAAWADAHHILPRSKGGTAEITNLVLLCRRCHRRVHHRAWRITMDPDAKITFRWRARMWTSPPPRE